MYKFAGTQNTRRMKKITILSFWLVLGFISLSCKKETEENRIDVSTINVTVKNQDENLEPNIVVYLFSEPSTELNGKNPEKALKSAKTNQNGVATIDVQNLSEFKSGGSFFITALEPLLSGEYHVLGSAEVASEEVATLEKEIIVSERTLKYNFGFLPTTITSELAQEEYNRWKSTQVVACGDGLRVISDQSSITLVEAIGFGTLMAAYADDKTTFDGLMRFYKNKRTPESKNMMGWKVTCDGIIDPGSATDGDLDVAFALIVANKQWGDQAYLDDAKAILQIVRDNLIVECSVDGGIALVIGPGYSGIAWGGCEMMDIMYHTPAFFRVFAKVTGDNIWETLANDTYTLLAAGANPTTGLMPDWQTAEGAPGPGGRVGHFGYDACRSPWRLTLDYLWNGNEQAKEWTIKLSNWANGVGPKNIVDGYELDGTPLGKNGLNSAFLGGFAVATMSNNQSMANSFGTEMGLLKDTYWFNLNTRVLYLLTLTGNFKDPLK